MDFKLDFLHSYDDESLLAEVRRVSDLVSTPNMSRRQFDEHARVHSSTLGKRFGTWEAALKATGLAHRFDDQATPYDKDELLESIRRIGQETKPAPLTLDEFSARTGIGGGPVRRCFGTWKAALEEAGLTQSALGKRYSDEQCFENILNLWTHYGRAPQHDEANSPPSAVGAKAYVRRWGTWRKALTAFVTRVSEPSSATETEQAGPAQHSPGPMEDATQSDRGPRDVPLALRYYILKRDRFRCVTCGRSPATHPTVHLHIDHIVPWVAGGRTVAENLRSLCSECNLGKGASHASEA